MVINLVTIVLFSDGIISSISGNMYFLGTRVTFTRYFFLFIIPAGLEYIYYKKKMKLLIILGTSIFSFVKYDVSTAITCCLVLIVLFLAKDKLKSFIKLNYTLPVTMTLSAAFIFCNAANWFRFFIENVLNKNLTLTKRTEIWNIAVKMIVETKEKLLLGHGIVNKGDFVYNYGVYWPAHNQLLQWVFEYGVLGTFFVALFIMYMGSKTDTDTDSFFINAICFAIFIACITSCYFNTYVGFVCVGFAYFVKKLRPDKNIKNNVK